MQPLSGSCFRYRPGITWLHISHQQVANYDLALWVTYYNFLRPHKEFKYKPPVQDSGLAMAGNMPGKWQYLIAMGQQTILCMQQNCS
jgi:hypothetical protein